MSSDALHERGQALEDVFFRTKDQQLLEKMKADLAAKDEREALRSATGVEDDSVLDALIQSGIAAESLTSVSLIPLVAVAWADGKMEDGERQAILKSADQSGIRQDQPAHALIASWLDEQPGAELLNAWKDYVGALKANIDATAFGQLRSKVLERAENVASSAGGFLGLGNKISDVERKVLDELAATFDA